MSNTLFCRLDQAAKMAFFGATLKFSSTIFDLFVFGRDFFKTNTSFPNFLRFCKTGICLSDLFVKF